MRLKMFAILVLLVASCLRATSTTFPIDKNHSSVAFHVPIMGGMSKVHGKFSDFDIQLNYDETDVSKSSVTATIKVVSIDTGIHDRDEDLRGDNFFDAAKYPNIVFESKRVEKQGDHILATGTLTMHGVSREIALPITLSGTFTDPATKKQVMGFGANIMLNRRDYGINWEHSAMATFVSDNVEVELEILTKMK
jgi:polyisoprenoid-binding protein YceI